ncbi:MAG: sensor histidine kinase [bacterium]
MADTEGIRRLAEADAPAPREAIPESPAWEAACRFLAGEYSPPAILLDGEFDILGLFGNAAHYLRPVDAHEQHSLVQRALPDLDVVLPAAFHRAHRNRSTVLYRDVEIGAPGGAQSVDIRVHPLRAESGEPYYLVVIEEEGGRRPRSDADTWLEAIARKDAQLAEEVRRRREVERLNQSLQDFASMASHDLREPLRSISMFSELLEGSADPRLDARSQGHLARIRDGIARMRDLIDDLLTFSRVPTADLDRQPVRLADVLSTAVEDLRSQIDEAAASVSWEALPTVSGERVLFEDLFQNLIANAVKYRSARPPRIFVTAEEGDDEWLVSVEDNGVGIREEDRREIFRPLKRAVGTGDRRGTGMGLAIAQRIVERHGGEIWVESALGKGSVFRFTIPK